MQDQMAMRRIHGSCHCGNIRFTFDRPGPDDSIPVRVCSCNWCRKHNAAWTSHPQGRFTLQIGDEDLAGRYRFGTMTADFHLCLTCGVLPIVTCTLDGSRYAVVNVHTFDDVDQSQFDQSQADFADESKNDRLARRKRNWTPEAVAANP